MAFDKIMESNRAWAAKVEEESPGFFNSLVDQQTPEYLWIGCSDSRVPANQIAGIAPGEVFVHRNIANVVVHSDFNCLSVIQFAIDILKVKHVLVVGHYGCSGVKAALDGKRIGLADNWLLHIRNVYEEHSLYLCEDFPSRHDRLCELNAVEQAYNITQTTIVQDAWERGQRFTVHGCIYSLANGHLHDLNFHVSRPDQVEEAYQHATTLIHAKCI